MALSIGGLNKSVKTFCSVLEKQGFEIVDYDLFKDGSAGGNYGGSYVEIEIRKDGFIDMYKFMTQYGVNSETEFCDPLWSVMKKRCLIEIEKSYNDYLETKSRFE